MTEYDDTRLHDERALQERIRHVTPLVAVGVLCALIAGVLLWALSAYPAQGALIAWGVFIGALVLVTAFIKPEIALIVVTILAPLEVYTQQIRSVWPGTGLTALNVLVIILIAGAWAQKYSTSEPAAPATKVDARMMAVLVIGLLAVITGVMKWNLDSQDIGAWQQFALAMLMYWVGRRRFRSVGLAKVLVFVVCCMVLVECFYVVRQYGDHNTTAFEWKLKFTITGTIINGNSNDTGAYLTQYGALALGLFLGLRRSPWRWFALFVYGASVVATFYTYSRGAYLALFIAAASMLLWKQRRWLVPFALAAVFLLPLLPSSISERLNTSGDDSAENRKEFWKEGMKMCFLPPFIGQGWRGYSKNQGHDPHNMYVLIASEQGPLGLAAFLALLVAAGREIIRANRVAKQSFTQALALGMWGSYVALLVNNMFGSRLVWFYAGAHFWLLLGVMLVLLTREATAVPSAEAPEPSGEHLPVVTPPPSVVNA